MERDRKRSSQKIMLEKRVDDQASEFRQTLGEAQKILQEHLTRLGLKRSTQRELILRVFLKSREHLSTEELHALVKRQDPTVGYTTVYRTLKLLNECGLAAEVEFHDGVARYEHRLNRRNHHHMICTGCSDSVEFFSPEIEEIEHRIGASFHYATSRHSFQIYGLCEACQEKAKKPVHRKKKQLQS
ncbi:Fur family transcriptional regulator [Telmatobacter bradus]|uniref:Fur family transcriptional regulator n=1 Tax=Telmatobacter bradus TaxID=474953 RepID=UPI003B4330ED